MSTHIFNSTAFLNFINGEHIKDFQVIIDDEETFNALPGKYERHGIKTLSDWPIFVTAVLNEATDKADYVQAARIARGES